MVDYLGDMTKPYQNGVDRVKWGVSTDMQNITKGFRFFFYVLFIFINEPTAQTAGANLTVNGSKHVVWRKDVPFGGQINVSDGFGGNLPPKHPLFSVVVGISIINVAK
jgi:hypothetical protein